MSSSAEAADEEDSKDAPVRDVQSSTIPSILYSHQEVAVGQPATALEYAGALMVGFGVDCET